MPENNYFATLYEIASHLNQAFTLGTALRQALEKTVQLLELEGGWIWLTQADGQSVYLAASYHLPKALSEQPERLSGWCYCIEKYLTNDIQQAGNVSEISCTRLKDIPSQMENIKFHATVPITVGDQKMGILNLLHKDSQQLDDTRLAILQTISELIAMSIQRTRTQAAYVQSPVVGSTDSQLLHRLLYSGISELDYLLQKALKAAQNNDNALTIEKLKEAMKSTSNINQQMDIIKKEIKAPLGENPKKIIPKYPNSPLTNRELEVLQLVKKGLTNRQIAEQLYITERTIKFHLTAILSKLDASTRTEAVNVAIQRGLLGVV